MSAATDPFADPLAVGAGFLPWANANVLKIAINSSVNLDGCIGLIIVALIYSIKIA